MVDLHCHLLPGLEDGPGTLQDSLALAAAMVAQGTRTVAATPHVSFDFPNDRAALREAPAIHGVDLEVWEGADVLRAHPERCPAFQRRPRALRRLVGDGALLSITASSLTGAFGRPARDLARRAVRQRLADIASDAHGAARRSPVIRGHLDAAAAQTPGLREQAGWLTTVAPATIVAGTPLDSQRAARGEPCR